MKHQVVCLQGPKWLAERLNDRRALAPLTGQDARALAAFFHLLELYAVADARGQERALSAMRETVGAMQPTTQHLARLGIPHVLDWNDEAALWRRLQVLGTPNP